MTIREAGWFLLCSVLLTGVILLLLRFPTVLRRTLLILLVIFAFTVFALMETNPEWLQ